VQAQVESEEDAGARDAEAIAQQDRQREAQSHKTLEELKAQFTLAKTFSVVEEIAKTVTPALKKTMLADHVNQLREAYHAAYQRVKAANGNNGSDRTLSDSPLAQTLRASIADVAGRRA
jgi:hypothetical protein